jgi:CheY-like chemotaxis protein
MILQGKHMFNEKPRVILVDDNRDAVDMLSRLLNYSGVDNRTAYDGYSAVALLRDWPAHVVFLDIQMPGMNGYETAIAMHALPDFAQLPIIALTAWDGIGTQQLAEAAKFVHRLIKPAKLHDILDAIKRFGAPAS